MRNQGNVIGSMPMCLVSLGGPLPALPANTIEQNYLEPLVSNNLTRT